MYENPFDLLINKGVIKFDDLYESGISIHVLPGNLKNLTRCCLMASQRISSTWNFLAMLNRGQVIMAVVTAVKYNAVVLEASGNKFLLLAPDASINGTDPVHRTFHLGNVVQVKVKRYSQNDGIYRVVLARDRQ